MHKYIIEGHIQRSGKNGKPIHGILVEGWGDTCSGDKLAGSALTDKAGKYRLELDHLDLEVTGKNRIAIQIMLFDRDGNRIYVSRDKKQVRPQQPTRVDLRLHDNVLSVHDQQPVSFDSLIEEMPSAHALRSDIEAAIELLAEPGSPRYMNLRRSAFCPAPDIDIMDQLARDAINVLDGNPAAEQRFRLGLESLLRVADNDPARRESIMKIFRQQMERNYSLSRTSFRAPASKLPAPGSDAPPASPALPVMAAAMHIYGTDFDIDSPIPGVLDVLCRFESLLNLRRFAIDAQTSAAGLRNFGGLLGSGECGPDDAPIPGRRQCPTPPRENPGCYLELADLIRRSGFERYRITAIMPARACSGELITITGSGFTDTPGTVIFNLTGNREQEVEAETWTDTQITVRVPPEASCGLRLRIRIATNAVCGRFLDIYRLGTIERDFAGSAPDILSLRVNGKTGTVCVLPGQTVLVSWQVCAADSVRITLFDQDGNPVASRSPAPANGSFSHVIPDTDETQRWRIHLHATGSCSPEVAERNFEFMVYRRPHLSIQGMEVTQAIQYYRANRHLSDPNDRGPDNSLPLVTGKAAWVRVYLRSGQSPDWNDGEVGGVTGTLRIERINNDGSVTMLTTLNPQNTSPVTAQANPNYATERGDINSTLNFVIPANLMSGRLRLMATVESPEIHCGNRTASASTTINVNLQQTLQVAYIAVGYNGPNGAGTGNLTLAAPGLAASDATLPYTLSTLPVSATFTSRVAGTITLGRALTDAASCAGCCTPNWISLMNQIQNAASNDGNQANWLYYGIMANGIPTGPVIGCASGGVGAGTVGDQVTMAHEISHQLGRPHAPCGGVGAGDPAYPAYEPYDPAGTPTASTGEYGLDIRNGTIHPPSEKDFMSYCGPSWISIYGYQQTLNQAPLQPVTITGGSTGMIDNNFDRRDDLISLTGYVDDEEHFHVTTVARVTARPIVIGGQASRIKAELLDKTGKPLSTARLHITGPRAGDNDRQPPWLFQALIPFSKGGHTLRLREKETIHWQRQAFATQPKVDIKKAEIDKEGKLHLEWSAEHDAKAVPEYWLQWSGSNNKQWQGLATGLEGNSCCIDVSHLPAGNLRVRLLLHDGFHTTSDRSKSLRNPFRAPGVVILHPADGSTLPTGGLVLQGQAVDCHGKTMPDEDLIWEIDGKEVARGAFAVLDSRIRLSGKQTVSLRAGDRHGKTTVTHTVHFREPGQQTKPC